MKRLVVSALVVAFLAQALPTSAVAQPPKERTVEAGYMSPMVWTPIFGTANCREGIGCQRFLPGKNEYSIKVVTKDASGSDVYFYVHQDVDRDGFSDTPDGLAAACNQSEWIPIEPRVAVNVFIVVGPWSPCAFSTPTTGTVTATFSTKPADGW